jgi:CheY-like chemotaxis protein
LKVFARGEQESRMQPVDVRRAVELSCKMADNVIRHRARLLMDFEPVGAVEASESRLCQVFLNLLLNAAQAIPEGVSVGEHEIRVRIRALGAEKVSVEVSDTGVGMPADVLARAFDPFFTTKPVGEGTGLGLSICHGIIESMGGTIVAESELGRGSTFRVVLRAAQREAEPLRQPTVAQPTPRARILVVDDEPNVTTALQRSLATEHDVATANSAQAALKLMVGEGSRFDLVLCDVMMPGMTGMDLYAELGRQAPEMLGRLVFMTGGAFTPRAVAFLRDVPNPTLSKPLDLGQLRALVGRAAMEAQR